MRDVTVAAFFDELEKIGIASATPNRDSFGKAPGDGEQSTGDLLHPSKPAEARPPITPPQMKPKVIDSPFGRGTNYTRSNVEAPGANMAVTLPQKNTPPPPVRF